MPIMLGYTNVLLNTNLTIEAIEKTSKKTNIQRLDYLLLSKKFLILLFQFFIARVLSYDIAQGNLYSGIAWEDTKYTLNESNNGFLSDGTGCLLEESGTTNPFIKPKYWIGQNKKKNPNPLIAFLFTKKDCCTWFVFSYIC